MENNYPTINDAPGKIRSRAPKSHRTNPYSKSRDRNQNTIEQRNVHDQSLIGKVTSYIVPSWISGWWSQDNKNTNSDVQSDNEDDVDPPTSNQFIDKHVIFETQNTQTAKVTLTSDVTKKIVLDSTLGFYERNRTLENTQTLIRPSFLDDTKEESEIVEDNSRKRKVTETPDLSIASNNDCDASTSKLFTPGCGALRCNRQPFAQKPTFKVSAFVAPTPQSTKQSTVFNMSVNSSFDFTSGKRSPFYSGHTRFGGSSSFREQSTKRQKISPVSNRVRTTRTQVKAKPLPTVKRSAVTSETAKRILSTLGSMSSPVRDSRRLPPLRSPPISTSFSKQLRQMKGTIKVIDPSKPPIENLNCTQALSVDKKLPSSDAKEYVSFNFTKNHKAVASQQEQQKNIPTSFQQHSVPTELKPKDSIFQGKSSMKMKRDKTTAHYSSSQKDEEVVNTLPSISVAAPLIAKSVPKFNFSVATNNTISNFTPITKPRVEAKTKQIKGAFNFAEPGIIADKTLLSTPGIKQFAFSTPAAISTKSTDSLPKDESLKTSFKLQGEIKEVKKLNFLPKPVAGTWDCDVCLIQNKPELNKCVACETAKPMKSTEVKKPVDVVPQKVISQNKFSLSSKFQKQKDSWECPMCMIQNNCESNNCIACNEPKPNSSNNVSGESKSAQVPMFKLKMAKVTGWECPTCLINNKETDIKCVACTESRPSTKDITKESKSPVVFCSSILESKFGPAEGSWECPVCMLSNRKDCLKCVACCESKPGATTDLKVPTTDSSSGFKFGTTNAASGFSFGKPASTDTSSAFSFGKPNTTDASSGFSFGKPASTDTSSGFSFGKPTTTADNSSGFSFGKPASTDTSGGFSVDKPASTNTTSGFSFGKPASTDTSSGFSVDKPALTDTSTGSSFNKPTLTDTSSEFSFGKPASTADNFSGFSFGKPPSTDTTSGFSFGKHASTDISSGFSFGKPTSADTSSLPSLVKSASTDASAGFSFDKSAKTEATSFEKRITDTNKSSGFSFGTISEKEAEKFGQADANTSESTISTSKYSSIAAAASAGILNIPGVTSTSISDNSQKPLANSVDSVKTADQLNENKIGSLFNTDATEQKGFSLGSTVQNGGFDFGKIGNTTGFFLGKQTDESSMSSNSLFANVSKPSTAFAVDASNAKPATLFGGSELATASFSFSSKQTTESSSFNVASNEKSSAAFGSSSVTNVFASSTNGTEPFNLNTSSSSTPFLNTASVSSSFNFDSTSTVPFNSVPSNTALSFNFGSGNVPSFQSDGLQTKASFNFTQNDSTAPNLFTQPTPAAAGDLFTQPAPVAAGNLFSFGQSSANNSAGGGPQRRPIKRAQRRIRK